VELVVIDNASSISLSGEIDLQLATRKGESCERTIWGSRSSLRGSKETTGELIVLSTMIMCLPSDYLRQAVTVQKNGPRSERLRPDISEFEAPRRIAAPLLGMLRVTDFKQDRWSN